jgi:DHA1 family bicyclomycin/chloramphenicol resistance-like MFS transporter
VFLVGLAASQLVWAEVLTHLGPRRSVKIGVWLLVLASAGAALAPSIEVLIVMRLILGIAAGAATVVAPSVVRATLSDADAVRGLAAIAMVEAIVPALGPVLGAILLAHADWRATFWVLGGVTLAAIPFVLRAAPHELPGLDRRVVSSYASILANRRFARLALSHALSMGALLTFIASAPQLMINSLGLGTSAFATLQVISVIAFALTATQSGRISAKLGAPRAVQLGAWIQLGLCATLLALGLFVALPFAVYAVFWPAFCAALAIRGPSAFSEALKVPASQLGRASAVMVLAILLAGAIGTQVVAPFMDGRSATGLLVGMLVPCVISLVLVIPYPSSSTDPVRPQT